MEKILPTFQFLRLVDETNKLSLTNIAVIAAVCNLLFVQHASIEHVAAFIGSLVSYQAKKYLLGQPTTDADDIVALKEQVAKLQTSVTAVQLANNKTFLNR